MFTKIISNIERKPAIMAIIEINSDKNMHTFIPFFIKGESEFLFKEEKYMVPKQKDTPNIKHIK